jgi:hypothetical protein
MSDRTMEVLPLPRCCPTLRGLRLGTLIPNKCTLHAELGPHGGGRRLDMALTREILSSTTRIV